jgi:uncharacterized protein YhhL (DUF1145 family)
LGSGIAWAKTIVFIVNPYPESLTWCIQSIEPLCSLMDASGIGMNVTCFIGHSHAKNSGVKNWLGMLPGMRVT